MEVNLGKKVEVDIFITVFICVLIHPRKTHMYSSVHLCSFIHLFLHLQYCLNLLELIRTFCNSRRHSFVQTINIYFLFDRDLREI